MTGWPDGWPTGIIMPLSLAGDWAWAELGNRSPSNDVTITIFMWGCWIDIENENKG